MRQLHLHLPLFPGRWLDRLCGVRPGFGDGARVIAVAREADFRHRPNWGIPMLAGLFALFLLATLKLAFEEDSSIGGMMFRVFVFDYSLFLFGGLSGWNVARRWRANSDHVEEISLTPLPPSVIGNVMSAGVIRIWLRVLALFCLIDLLTPIPQMRALFLVPDFGSSRVSGTGFLGLALLYGFAALLVPPVMAWFHFESIRLAHWMFSIHSLPRVSLAKAGIHNFLLMTMIVGLLSALGSMVTVFVAMLLTALGAVISLGGIPADRLIESYSVWGLGAIPGALAVVALKRLMSRHYERSFSRAWLLYQWWGAGERTQPSTYPRQFYTELAAWGAYYGMREEEEAGVPPALRKWEPRYRVLACDTGPATSDSNSDSPFQSPDQHSGHAHDQASASGKARSSEWP
ncbi:hypothetical protein HZA57_00785 [Candidatus Poribacteria bacterium]|nr:hypothetical protein [Candidatus Poribacteria bacterium]